MKLIILSLFVSVALLGCNETPNTNTPAEEDISSAALKKTEGLQDCNIYSFHPTNYSRSIYIVRCKGLNTVSTTESYQENKQTVQRTTITVDGVKYHVK